MKTNRKYNWPELIASFEASGLTQTAFCNQNNINPKYFNQKLNKEKIKQDTRFSKVEVDTSAHNEIQGFVLQVGNVKIHCPDTMPLQSFLHLVNQLA